MSYRQSQRKRYEYDTKKQSTFTLNITSMTDMFTILLVFLLQTYSTSDVQVNIDQGQRLPSSTSQSSPVKSIQISLTKNELKISDQTIAKLVHEDFENKDISNSDSNFITPLFAELEKFAKDEKLKGNILMKADESLPYGVLRKVMYTASMAGFPNLKMATVVGQ
jgi:biopolymer transport protein ExbD